jgi:hypothetical protein
LPFSGQSDVQTQCCRGVIADESFRTAPAGADDGFIAVVRFLADDGVIAAFGTGNAIAPEVVEFDARAKFPGLFDCSCKLLFFFKEPKKFTFQIKGQPMEFYTLPGAGKRLSFSGDKLRKGLLIGRFSFKWFKSGDTQTAPIYVLASDVEAFIRHRDGE